MLMMTRLWSAKWEKPDLDLRYQVLPSSEKGESFNSSIVLLQSHLYHQFDLCFGLKDHRT